MPEVRRQVNLEFPRGKEFNNNLCSGMFRFVQGIGQVCGPVMGNYLVVAIDFPNTLDIFGFIWLGYGVLYFLIGGGYEACSRNRKEKPQFSETGISNEKLQPENQESELL